MMEMDYEDIAAEESDHQHIDMVTGSNLVVVHRNRFSNQHTESNTDSDEPTTMVPDDPGRVLEGMSVENVNDQDQYDSSDTSDDDLWFGNLSTASSESSLAGYGDNMGFFELMNQHLEIFNHEDSFFRGSLRTLYETLMEYMEDKPTPTPQAVIDTLPTMKVTLDQIESNLACSICFAEYEKEEEQLKLPCNHFYHKTCIVSWLKLKSTCPTCRLDLSKDSNRSCSVSTNSTTDERNAAPNGINTDSSSSFENEFVASIPFLMNSAVSIENDTPTDTNSISSNTPGASSTSSSNRDDTPRHTAVESNVVRNSSTSRTKRSTTLTASSTTKRYSRETDIW